jgi:hypothetical protein
MKMLWSRRWADNTGRNHHMHVPRRLFVARERRVDDKTLSWSLAFFARPRSSRNLAFAQSILGRMILNLAVGYTPLLHG